MKVDVAQMAPLRKHFLALVLLLIGFCRLAPAGVAQDDLIISLIPSFSWDMKESAGHEDDSGKNRMSAGGGISLRIRQATFAVA